MRGGKAGPRRPANPPRRTPLPPAPGCPARGGRASGAGGGAAPALPAPYLPQPAQCAGERSGAPARARARPLGQPRRGLQGDAPPFPAPGLPPSRSPPASGSLTLAGVASSSALPAVSPQAHPTPRFGAPLAATFSALSRACLSPDLRQPHKEQKEPGQSLAWDAQLRGERPPGPSGDGEIPRRVSGEQRGWKLMPWNVFEGLALSQSHVLWIVICLFLSDAWPDHLWFPCPPRDGCQSDGFFVSHRLVVSLG